MSSTAELFEAVRLGIVDKSEARRLLGLEAKRGRAAPPIEKSPPLAGNPALREIVWSRGNWGRLVRREDPMIARWRATSVTSGPGTGFWG